jgi:hypothetical protein
MSGFSCLKSSSKGNSAVLGMGLLFSHPCSRLCTAHIFKPAGEGQWGNRRAWIDCSVYWVNWLIWKLNLWAWCPELNNLTSWDNQLAQLNGFSDSQKGRKSIVQRIHRNPGSYGDPEREFLNNILNTSLPAHNNGKKLQSHCLLPYSTQALTPECMMAKSNEGYVLKRIAGLLTVILRRINPDL